VQLAWGKEVTGVHRNLVSGQDTPDSLKIAEGEKVLSAPGPWGSTTELNAGKFGRGEAVSFGKKAAQWAENRKWRFTDSL